MRALIVALVVVVGALLPGEAFAQLPGCAVYTGQLPTHREYVAFSGLWVRHGGGINVEVDGCGTLEMRTYEWCAPGREGRDPCDWIGADNIIHGGTGLGSC